MLMDCHYLPWNWCTVTFKIANKEQKSEHTIVFVFVSGVPQGSILRPLLFNIFLCDLFLSIENNYFANYADDTTPHVIGNNPDEVVSELKDITENLFTWFLSFCLSSFLSFLNLKLQLLSKFEGKEHFPRFRSFRF